MSINRMPQDADCLPAWVLDDGLERKRIRCSIELARRRAGWTYARIATAAGESRQSSFSSVIWAWVAVARFKGPHP
jgi:hypothetical protein